MIDLSNSRLTETDVTTVEFPIASVDPALKATLAVVVDEEEYGDNGGDGEKEKERGYNGAAAAAVAGLVFQVELIGEMTFQRV
jgi:hypothetical protein